LNTSAIGVVKASNGVLCRDKFKKIKRYSQLYNPSQNYVTVYLYVSNEGGDMILKSGSISQTKMMKISQLTRVLLHPKAAESTHDKV
jgi:hypothetical protein